MLACIMICVLVCDFVPKTNICKVQNHIPACIFICPDFPSLPPPPPPPFPPRIVTLSATDITAQQKRHVTMCLFLPNGIVGDIQGIEYAHTNAD